MGGKALSKVVDPVWIILFRMLKKATTPKILRPEDAPHEPEPDGNAAKQHSPSGSLLRTRSAPPMLLFNALRCGGSIKTESLRYDNLIQQYLVEPHIDLPHSNSSSSSTCTSTSTSTCISTCTSTSTCTSISSSSTSTSTSTSRSSSSSSFPHHSKPSFLHLPSMSRGAAHCFSRPQTDSFRVHHLVDQDALDTCSLNRSSNGRRIEPIEESLYSANSQGEEVDYEEEEEEEEQGLHSNSGASILLTCASSSSCCGGSSSSRRRCTFMASSPYSSCDEHYGTPASSFHNNAHRCSCLFSISGRIGGDGDWIDEEEEEEEATARTDLSDNARWCRGKCESVGWSESWDNAREKMMSGGTNVSETWDNVREKMMSGGTHVSETWDNAREKMMSGGTNVSETWDNAREKMMSGGTNVSESWDNAREKMMSGGTNVREKLEGSSSISSDRASSSASSCRADWVAMESDNPLADFSASIAEMVVCGKMRKEEELDALFEELVLINEPELRPTIALAFVDAMAYLSRLSSTLSSPSPFV